MRQFVFLWILCHISGSHSWYSSSQISLDSSSGSFDNINVVLLPSQFNASHCSNILQNVKVSFSQHHQNPKQAYALFGNVKKSCVFKMSFLLCFFQSVISSASQKLFEQLSGKFGHVNIRIPRSWTDNYCYNEPHIQAHQPFNSKVQNRTYLIDLKNMSLHQNECMAFLKRL